MSFFPSTIIMILVGAAANGHELARKLPHPPTFPMICEPRGTNHLAFNSMPVTPTPAASSGQTQITAEILELHLNGNSLALLYQKFTGHRVIVSALASTAEFRLVVDASPKHPVSYAKAAELIKTIANIENFTFVVDDKDPNLEFLTVTTSHHIRGCGGIEVYDETRRLPDDDNTVITYVMTLNHIEPGKAKDVFTRSIGKFGPYGSIAPVPNAAALVITESTSIVRKLIELKKVIDHPRSPVEVGQ